MNIGNRIKYMIHVHHLYPIDLEGGPINQKEWNLILEGLLPLRPEQAAYLAAQWNIPFAYLAEHDQIDLDIHRQLQELQHDLLINDELVEERIKALDQPLSLHSIVQEVIFHLLKSVYFYKKNQPAEAEQIEKQYLSIMLPNHHRLKGSLVFQKALFYYFGFKYFYEGKRDESSAYFEQLLDKTADKDEVVSIVQNLTLISKENNDYDQAITYMKKLETFSQEQSDDRGLSIAWNYLGALHLLKKNYLTSIAYFEQLNQLDVQPLMQSRLYHNLGVLYAKQKRYQDAISMYHQSIDVKKMNGVTEELFLGYHALAKNYFIVQDMDASNHYLAQAKEIASTGDEISLLKMVEAEMLEKDDPKTAIALYEEAVSFYEKAQMISELDALYPILIRLYTEQGKMGAVRYYQQKHKQIDSEQDDQSKKA